MYENRADFNPNPRGNLPRVNKKQVTYQNVTDGNRYVAFCYVTPDGGEDEKGEDGGIFPKSPSPQNDSSPPWTLSPY